MKKYNDSDNALEMITDYTNYLTKYTKMMKKLENIDQSKLSEEDAKYYTKVMARINKKLASVTTGKN